MLILVVQAVSRRAERDGFAPKAPNGVVLAGAGRGWRPPGVGAPSGRARRRIRIQPVSVPPGLPRGVVSAHCDPRRARVCSDVAVLGGPRRGSRAGAHRAAVSAGGGLRGGPRRPAPWRAAQKDPLGNQQAGRGSARGHAQRTPPSCQIARPVAAGRPPVDRGSGATLPKCRLTAGRAAASRPARSQTRDRPAAPRAARALAGQASRAGGGDPRGNTRRSRNAPANWPGPATRRSRPNRSSLCGRRAGAPQGAAAPPRRELYYNMATSGVGPPWRAAGAPEPRLAPPRSQPKRRPDAGRAAASRPARPRTRGPGNCQTCQPREGDRSRR